MSVNNQIESNNSSPRMLGICVRQLKRSNINK